MKQEPWSIREAYFSWLYPKVVKVRDLGSSESYIIVCNHMHSVKFRDNVPNDDNRTADGLELRNQFISSLPADVIDFGDYAILHRMGNKASVLEVLIGLALRAETTTSISPETWFRTFLDNLGLSYFGDSLVSSRDTFRIGRIIRTFNTRAYSSNGKGGIFPLKNAENDQRTVELWFQMSAYMTENHMY